jgi:membrane fusion protein, multidrug efflux system
MQLADAAANRERIRVHREPAGSPTQTPGKKKSLFRRPAVIIGIAAVAIVGIIYGATLVFHSLTHQSTDDAFVDTHVVSVAPKIAGSRNRGASA